MEVDASDVSKLRNSVNEERQSCKPEYPSSGDVTLKIHRSESNRIDTEHAENQLLRGFTITISPPADYNDSKLSIWETDSSVGEECSSPDTERKQRSSFCASSPSSFDLLVPEVNQPPDLTLDRTESRLPSLESMFADKEIEKIFIHSAHHREIQEALVVEDKETKYANLVGLIQKSYENEQWRSEASSDLDLLDSLALFCRQKISILQEISLGVSEQLSRSSSRSFRSCSKKPISRAASMKSWTGEFETASPQSNSASRERSVVVLALLSSCLRFLRNLCVRSPKCQTHIHEHRLVDLVLDRIDMMIQLKERLDREEQSSLIERGYKWAFVEVKRLGRTIIQFVTNAVSGNVAIQRHVLSRILPIPLLELILFSRDADLILCLLHCLTAKLDSKIIFDSFLYNEDGITILYITLSCSYLNNPETKDLDKNNLTKVHIDKNREGKSLDWAEVFLSEFLKQQYQGENALVLLLNKFIQYKKRYSSPVYANKKDNEECLLLSSSQEFLASKRTDTVYKSEEEKDNSNNYVICAAALENCHLRETADSLMNEISKDNVISKYLEDIEMCIDVDTERALAKPESKTESLAWSILNSEQSLLQLGQLFKKAAYTVVETDCVTEENYLFMRLLSPLMNMLLSLSVFVSLVDSSIKRIFSQLMGQDILVASKQLLTYALREKKRIEFSEGKISYLTTTRKRPSSSLKSFSCSACILLISNIGYKNLLLQDTMSEMGFPFLLIMFCSVFPEICLAREAAILAIRNCSTNEKFVKSFADSLAAVKTHSEVNQADIPHLQSLCATVNEKVTKHVAT